METQLITNLLTLSQNEGYIAPNYTGDKVTTTSGYIIAEGDAIYTEEGDTWHCQLDSEEFGYDEINECYRNESSLCYAYAKRGKEMLCRKSECIPISGNLYHEEYLDENGIVTTYEGDYRHIDDCYYWESDGEYHNEEEEEISNLWDYQNGPLPPDKRNGDKFGIGFEIEKSTLPTFPFIKEDVFSEYGAVMERDGSVSEGFELKTPVYSLYSSDTDNAIKSLKKFINVRGEEGAGGHINFSHVNLTDVNLLNKVRGFLPLIYAMYPSRCGNTYCTAKKVENLIHDKEKYQSIRLRGDYIEFRIFGAVKNIDTLQFRLNLFRIIGQNLGASFFSVLTQLITEGTELNYLFRSTFYADNQKFISLIRRAMNMDKNFGTNRLNKETIENIDTKLNELTIK